MKRLFAALLSLVLALLLMGCSSAPANDPTPGAGGRSRGGQDRPACRGAEQ